MSQINVLDYKIYSDEIVHFLKTINLKFELFAFKVKNDIYKATGVLVDDIDNPYYINMCGDYSKYDTPMYINSVEDGSSILFSKDLQISHPRTFSLYNINSQEYKNLCTKYPQQVGLIKNIIYPAPDINTVISSPDISLINADYSLLHPNEVESVKTALHNILDLIYTKWYIEDYDYEEGYPIVLMGVILHTLYMCIRTQRILNIKTEHAHPLHIWEYLESKGLKDYRDVLSNSQVLFLYRNMEYILNNRGKKSNLYILAENILEGLHVSLVGKKIYQDTAIKEDIALTRPEFINDDILISDIDEQDDNKSIEDMDDILGRLHAENLYPEYSLDDTTDMEYKFSRTEFNVLNTRLLEFKKHPISTRYLSLLTGFLMDTLHYQLKQGNIGFKVSFRDPELTEAIELTVADALVLFNYVHHRESGELPVLIPKYYEVRYAYTDTKPPVPRDFIYREYEYPYIAFINPENIINSIPFLNYNTKSQLEFMQVLDKQFACMARDVKFVNLTSYLPNQNSMCSLYNEHLLVNYRHIIPFSQYTTYEEWLNTNESIKKLLDIYDSSVNPKTMYRALCDRIVTALFPLEGTSLGQYIGADKDDTIYYTKLKQLFIQLCSYRLTFLDTERNSDIYVTEPFTAFQYTDIFTSNDMIIDMSLYAFLELESITDSSDFEHINEIDDLTLELYSGLDISEFPPMFDQPIEIIDTELEIHNVNYLPEYVEFTHEGDIVHNVELKATLGSNYHKLI